MIRQPEKGSRNVNDIFYVAEKRKIDLLNQVLGEVELTAQEENTLIWLVGGVGRIAQYDTSYRHLRRQNDSVLEALGV